MSKTIAIFGAAGAQDIPVVKEALAKGAHRPSSRLRHRKDRQHSSRHDRYCS